MKRSEASWAASAPETSGRGRRRPLAAQEKERDARNTCLGDGVDKGTFVLDRESGSGPPSQGFLSGVLGRISMECSSALQVCPFRWSPVIGQHGGRESSVSTAGPDISHGVSQPGVAAFPDLELTPS